jgi:hypothetical protein
MSWIIGALQQRLQFDFHLTTSYEKAGDVAKALCVTGMAGTLTLGPNCQSYLGIITQRVRKIIG